jgi:hypothetical protein
MEAFIFYPLTPRATILQRGIAAFFRIHDGFGTLMVRPSDDADDVTWGVYHRFFGHALSYPIFHNVPHQYTPHLHSSHSMTPWDPNGICLRIFLQLDWLFEALHQ